MKKSLIAPAGETRMPGIHARGRADFHKVTRASIREEEAKLRRRLGRFCKSRGIVGDFLVFSRRRKLLRKLRNRFEVPYALFIGGHK